MRYRYNKNKFFRAFAFMFIGTISIGASAQTSAYASLVGIGVADYNLKYSPSNVNFIVDKGVVTTGARIGESYVLKQRIFIPPGTKQFAIALWAYTGSMEIKGSMKLNALPTLDASAVNVDTVSLVETNNTLQQLIDGKEVIFYANGQGGGVNLITPAFNPVLATEGGWLYLNIMQLPGMRTQTLQAVIATDEACYRNWFAHAQFDSMGNPMEGVKHTCSGSLPTPVDTVVESTASDGTLKLTIPVKPTNMSDLAKNANLFVAARYYTMGNMVLLFNTPNGWKEPAAPNLDSYFFSNVTQLAPTQNITVPIGLTKSALSPYGVEIFVGYKTIDGTVINNLGKVWP